MGKPTPRFDEQVDVLFRCYARFQEAAGFEEHGHQEAVGYEAGGVAVDDHGEFAQGVDQGLDPIYGLVAG